MGAIEMNWGIMGGLMTRQTSFTIVARYIVYIIYSPLREYVCMYVCMHIPVFYRTHLQRNIHSLLCVGREIGCQNHANINRSKYTGGARLSRSKFCFQGDNYIVTEINTVIAQRLALL